MKKKLKKRKNISPPRYFKFIASRFFCLVVVYFKNDMLDDKNSTGGLIKHCDYICLLYTSPSPRDS